MPHHDPDDPTLAAYDAMGAAYADKSASSLYNAYYERPAMITLLPPLDGRRILEAGCGGGALARYLVASGAHVTGVDASPALIQVARQRVPDGDFRVADLRQPLDFVPDASLDLIVSALVLHYIEDWTPVFAEFARMLKPGGHVVFSTHHPHADWRWFDRPNYFVREQYEDTWTLDGQAHQVRFYHRTLDEMFGVFRATGFGVDVLREPQPVAEAEAIDPDAFQRLSTTPHFILFRLKRDPR